MLLHAIYQKPLAIQSDTARRHAAVLAAAASLGLITTETDEGYGRTWRVTQAGLKAVKEGFL